MAKGGYMTNSFDHLKEKQLSLMTYEGVQGRDSMSGQKVNKA